MFKNIEEIIEEAKKTPPLRLAVAAAGDPLVLKSLQQAQQRGLVKPVLIGERQRIEEVLKDLDYDFNGEIIATGSNRESARVAMELIAAGRADLPMKGLLSTKAILKAMLAEEYGLRQGRLLSLVTLIYLDKEKRLILMTDGGMNIAPNLEEKVEIINNAVEVARALGFEKPRVAPLAAVEKVNPAMPATLDAAILSKMADRGQIKNAIIDGPLALDNAISIEAARHKGIDSPVAGRADILLVPDIEAGNILYKSLVFYSGLKAASLVYGARVPLVITSRADRVETKLNSIALAKVVVERMR
ncbi:MAG: phosphate butyryltransferase [Halanaerobiales bacterium]|nr:phosphate butyryltransferase [Halanaerobiales bacterium]